MIKYYDVACDRNSWFNSIVLLSLWTQIRKKINDKFIGEVSPDIGSLDEILKDDKIEKYIGMFDVKLHVPNNFNINKNKLVE